MESILDLIRDKQRIVFAGCCANDTFAAIVAHVLDFHNKKFDLIKDRNFLRQSKDAPIALIIASETQDSSGLADFRNYQHHIGMLTEIKFNQSNGYGDEDDYIRQYDLFADATPKAGLLAYCEQDPVASVLCNKEREDVVYLPYTAHLFIESDGDKYLINSNKDEFKVNIKSNNDLKWIGGAKELLKKIGVPSDQFYHAISSYRPA